MQSRFVTDVSSSFCPEMLFSSLVNAQICAWSKIDKAAKIVPRMNAARYLILQSIVNHPEGLGVTELARMQRITDGAASKLCDRLESAGLVTRKRLEKDKRRQVIMVTSEGRAVFEEARTHVRQAVAQFFSPLTTEEYLQLIDMLRRLSCGEENKDPKGDK
ncbi:MarR family transcriptional regulator [uncultured Corynebacterium sp.]|uniref:MarR family winged helix-turn-helix transcriptional regulator n=1 Tax=uncultured Corynebacterium sp. TaxID=159447 RepID=UPI0028E1CB03|nr:MarR family transcriptional regulator [uncultured Corynebacterium sp.]